MALAYLNEGATSFAAANWSDATGFAAAATLIISSGSSTIVTALDQSASSIDYLDIRPGFSGVIGSASAGALKFDADGGAVNRVRYAASGGALYLQAAGNNTLISTLNVNTGGFCYLLGGIFTTINLTSGTLSANGSTTFTTVSLSGGFCTIEAGTAGTTLNVWGGSHTIKRAFTTVNVYGGSVTWDADGTTITTLNQWGGTFRHINGTITTRNQGGGTYDASALRKDSTTGTANIYPNARFTIVSTSATLTVTTTNYIGDTAFGAAGNAGAGGLQP